MSIRHQLINTRFHCKHCKHWFKYPKGFCDNLQKHMNDDDFCCFWKDKPIGSLLTRDQREALGA